MGKRARASFRIVCCLGVVFGFLMTSNASAVVSTGVVIEGVPWYQQCNDWMCGPASLQIVFDYYGPYIDQREIGFAAQCIPSDPGTNLSGMIRAGHFSDLSSIDVSNCKIVGYTGRGLGYAAFSYSSNTFWLDGLKALIDMGYPVIVSGYWGYETSGNSDTIPASSPIGHFRVVVGYDDATREVIVNDPWGRDMKNQGGAQGSMKDNPGYNSEFCGIRFGYDYFNQLWSYNFKRSYSAVFISPWPVDISSSGTGGKLKVTATVTYPCPQPFDRAKYPASDIKVEISLPVGLELSKGEVAVKMAKALSAGDKLQVTWNLDASSEGVYDILVTAQGIVNGSYAGIPYANRIGGETEASVVVNG